MLDLLLVRDSQTAKQLVFIGSGLLFSGCHVLEVVFGGGVGGGVFDYQGVFGVFTAGEAHLGLEGAVGSGEGAFVEFATQFGRQFIDGVVVALFRVVEYDHLGGDLGDVVAGRDEDVVDAVQTGGEPDTGGWGSAEEFDQAVVASAAED